MHLAEWDLVMVVDVYMLALSAFDADPYINFLYSSTVNFLLSSIDVVISLLQATYYSGLWKVFTTSWLNIYSTVILFKGLKTIIF